MKKKTVIITGASRGIGKETARFFAQKGWNIVINYNTSENEAKELFAELSPVANASIFKADVSSKSETDALAEFTLKTYGGIDALINNAGISYGTMLFSDTSDADRKRLFDVNLFGTFNAVQSVLPHMLHKKSGSIVNVSSIWGLTGASCEVVYSSSKAAVIGFTKALSKELAPSSIRVNAVAPGVIDTKMNSFLSESERSDILQDIPLGRFGTPAEIASLIYFLSSDDSSYITGQVITADGGFIGI